MSSITQNTSSLNGGTRRKTASHKLKRTNSSRKVYGHKSSKKNSKKTRRSKTTHKMSGGVRRHSKHSKINVRSSSKSNRRRRVNKTKSMKGGEPITPEQEKQIVIQGMRLKNIQQPELRLDKLEKYWTLLLNRSVAASRKRKHIEFLTKPINKGGLYGLTGITDSYVETPEQYQQAENS